MNMCVCVCVTMIIITIKHMLVMIHMNDMCDNNNKDTRKNSNSVRNLSFFNHSIT